jgi:hypothetical protein
VTWTLSAVVSLLRRRGRSAHPGSACPTLCAAALATLVFCSLLAAGRVPGYATA